MQAEEQASEAVLRPTAGALIDVLLNVHRQGSLAGIINVTAAGAARLGAPALIGSLLRDAGTDAWYLTALVGAEGRPMLLDRLGVPHGPFSLTLLAGVGIRPLVEVFERSWGAPACARVAHHLDVRAAICLPMGDDPAPRGALAALLPTRAGGALVHGLLCHAAVAAGRVLHEEAPADPSRVLGPFDLAHVANIELERAARYERDVAVVVFQAETLEERARLGPILQRALRQWDALGRVDGERPTLAVVLPETKRAGGNGLVRRLGKLLTGIPTGSAAFPDDGTTLEKLLEVATHRAVRARTLIMDQAAAAKGSNTWSKGILSVTEADTVRCPGCLTIFSRRRPAGTTKEMLNPLMEAVRDALLAQCPRHQNQVEVNG